ncbi:hypothetical protein ACFE04_023613 [Oxalis oulophora]
MSSSLVLRSRLISNLSKNNKLIDRRFYCKNNVAAEAESLLGNQEPPPPEVAAPATSAKVPKGLRFAMYSLLTALTGATAVAGYVSYAYTLDEVEERTKEMRAAAASARVTPSEDASFTEKYKALIYSTAMSVPAKASELYLDLRSKVEEHVRGFTEPTSDKLLPDLHPSEQHVFTLVLDLNETLLYTDWKRDRGWRTFKRPGVDSFLEHMAKFYEIVVYSDQLNMYVDPVCERLDTKNCIRYRLNRSATKYQDGKHYRDFSKLNRDPAKILYVSGHAFESSLQPENCVPIKPYKLEADDTALIDLIPFLEYVARNSPADIRKVLESYEREDIAKEFLERSKDYQRRMQEQRQKGRSWFR